MQSPRAAQVFQSDPGERAAQPRTPAAGSTPSTYTSPTASAPAPGTRWCTFVQWKPSTRPVGVDGQEEPGRIEPVLPLSRRPGRLASRRPCSGCQANARALTPQERVLVLAEPERPHGHPGRQSARPAGPASDRSAAAAAAHGSGAGRPGRRAPARPAGRRAPRPGRPGRARAPASSAPRPCRRWSGTTNSSAGSPGGKHRHGPPAVRPSPARVTRSSGPACQRLEDVPGQRGDPVPRLLPERPARRISVGDRRVHASADLRPRRAPRSRSRDGGTIL